MRLSRAAVILLAAFAVLAGVALSGCSSKRMTPRTGAPATLDSGKPFEIFSGEYENTELMVKEPPRSLAVLPFSGDPTAWALPPDTEDPRLVVRRGMYNHIAALPFADQELFDTDARLASAELDSPEAVAALLESDPARLHELLGVDAVVLGEVTHYDRTFVGVVSQAAVGCRVRMVALPSGKLLWRAVHVSRGFGGGVSVTPVGLALSALSSLWNLREEQLLRESDALFREIAGTIHLPANLVRPLPPELDLFTVVNEAPIYHEGQPMIFRLLGAPAGLATARLTASGGFSRDVDLAPVPPSQRRALRGQLLTELETQFKAQGLTPGTEDMAAAVRELDAREIYQGAYLPEAGEEVARITARGVLVSATGGRSMRVLPTPLAIDAASPPAPAELAAEPGDGRIRLSWSPVQAKDLAAYEVWISESGLTGFTLAKTSEEPRAELDNLPNFNPRYLRVSAVDQAGNRSGFSPGAKATPLPDPALAAAAATSPELGGMVEGLLYLGPEQSPYLVTENLAVPEGSTLTVAPGVVVRFSPGTGLAVAGGALTAHGTREAPVRFVPQTPDSRPGSWTGLILDQDSRVLLNNVRILGPRVGLDVRGCAPRVDGAVIRAASQAGIRLSDGARPDVTCSLIKGNGGMGGLVAEGKGLAPSIRNSSFAGNAPFDVQNFSPAPLDLAGNHWTTDPGVSVLGQALLTPILDEPAPGCPLP